MEAPNNTHPPTWATRLLRWYCKSTLAEDLEGDLNEFFYRNVDRIGARKARLVYAIDVLKFIRPYTVRSPRFFNFLIQWIMLGSYLKTSVRNLQRNKLFSIINIFGLAISMSVGLMLIALLNDIYSYDKFHKNYNRIYRVVSQYQYLEQKDDDYYATTSLKAAQAIEESFTGHEGVAIVRRDFGGDVMAGERTIPLTGFWANESMFKVFSFPILEGDPKKCLTAPFSVVVTEQTAKKLFGNLAVVGNSIQLNGKNYTITAVIRDVPEFSHMHFDMLGSLSTRAITEKENAGELAWDNMWHTWTYVLMSEGVDIAEFQNHLDRLSAKEDVTVKSTHIKMKLQPLSDIMTGEGLSNEIGRTLGRTLVWVFSGLAFVVILSACFNYTNLSVARSLKRSREVGIRKVVGALKAHVLGQFITEAVLISMLSLTAAGGIFILIKPHFIGLNPDLQELLRLDLSGDLVLYFVLFAGLIGIFAGFFPALFFAKVNSIQVLKGGSSSKGTGKLTSRKALIVFQYCVSLMLITGTVIMYRQYHHFLQFDLGYQTENVLNIRLQGNKPELLMKELEELHEVKSMARASMITSVGAYWGETVKNPNDPNDSTGVRMNRVDEHYLPLLGHKLLAGRSFQVKPNDADETEIIVNEELLKRFDIADRIPAKAIGQVIYLDRKPMTIIGVIKDFQYGRANNKSGDPVIFRYIDNHPDYLIVKYETNDFVELNARIATIWKKLDKVHVYDAKLYNDQIREGFRGLDASMKLAGFIAFLAIVIASLGMLGMVVFTTETRVKEVSIRKTLGATEGGLLFLLGRGFIALLLMAAAIALPLTYLFFERIMLPKIANHAPITFNEMIVGLLAVMTVAMVMIYAQTLKIAKSNPAMVLKTE